MADAEVADPVGGASAASTVKAPAIDEPISTGLSRARASTNARTSRVTPAIV
ncbi:hypothetical protein ACI2L4_34300 [Streptomyces sparsogenes]|uniref:hypothetical protein n=1 Tax=Streptomyces sparsogenes TaxID=67365 RepID=UPI0033CB3B51